MAASFFRSSSLAPCRWPPVPLPRVCERAAAPLPGRGRRVAPRHCPAATSAASAGSAAVLCSCFQAAPRCCRRPPQGHAWRWRRFPARGLRGRPSASPRRATLGWAARPTGDAPIGVAHEGPQVWWPTRGAVCACCHTARRLTLAVDGDEAWSVDGDWGLSLVPLMATRGFRSCSNTATATWAPAASIMMLSSQVPGCPSESLSQARGPGPSELHPPTLLFSGLEKL